MLRKGVGLLPKPRRTFTPKGIGARDLTEWACFHLELGYMPEVQWGKRQGRRPLHGPKEGRGERPVNLRKICMTTGRCLESLVNKGKRDKRKRTRTGKVKKKKKNNVEFTNLVQ